MESGSTPRARSKRLQAPFAARTLLVASLSAACLASFFSAGAQGAISVNPSRARSVPVAAPKPARALSSSPTFVGVPIAIVDTGVAVIPALAGRVTTGDDLTGSGSTTDIDGHGTAMASIAGGGVSGICRVCTIIPVRAVGNSGLGTTELAAEGVTWAATHGARVINLSLTTSGNDPVLTAAIDNAVSAGVVVVLAAGNSGSSEPSAQGYPGASTLGAISVASANGGGLFSWSNYGSWVGLAAPGAVTASTPTGQTFTAIGTSASAAYISGVVGLMLSCNPTLSPAQVQSILVGTGTSLSGLGAAGRLVNVAAAAAASSSAHACEAAAQAATAL